MDKNDYFPWTQIPATFPIDIPGHHSLMNFSQDLNFYNNRSNWEYPFDQHDNFESALSSMVSSPVASVTPVAMQSGDDFQLIELIGKLGRSYSPGNNSSYSTPANSPPKLNLAIVGQMRGNLPPLPAYVTDPGITEIDARLSCFGSRSFDGGMTSQRLVNEQGAPASQLSIINHIHENKVLENRSDSKEESSVLQKVQSRYGNGRKRKAIAKGKSKNTSKVDVESKESNSKRGKINEDLKDGKSEAKEDSHPPEPPKDYIHVRARRGQATDSHSLAERVRREKISGKMKFLQDLVPGCNKVTGKAVMLDEIINYVQSLQRQVEGLSMKLATVNPIMDNAHMEALLSKEIQQSRMYSVESSNSASVAFPYAYQSQEPPCLQNENSFNNDRVQKHHRNLQLTSINGFSNTASQASMWGDELHNVVQMGFATGSIEPSQIKIEP